MPNNVLSTSDLTYYNNNNRGKWKGDQILHKKVIEKMFFGDWDCQENRLVQKPWYPFRRLKKIHDF